MKFIPLTEHYTQGGLLVNSEYIFRCVEERSGNDYFTTVEFTNGTSLAVDELTRTIYERVNIDDEKLSLIERERINERTIASLNLSARSTKALLNAGLRTVGSLVRIGHHGLRNIEGLGNQSLLEVEDKLREINAIGG